MDKKYTQIEFFLGSSVEEAVEELLNFKREGKLASGQFNGVVLYSDTVTMDSAFQQITGKTKSEFDELYGAGE